eukprot:250857-Prymnesium_polylepis.1
MALAAHDMSALQRSNGMNSTSSIKNTTSPKIHVLRRRGHKPRPTCDVKKKKNAGIDEAPPAPQAAEIIAERRRDAMQGQAETRRACDEARSSVWVWEGRRDSAVGQVREEVGREGGRVGSTTTAPPHTRTHTHAGTHRGVVSERDRHSVPAAE